jgi:hypothetical protein
MTHPQTQDDEALRLEVAKAIARANGDEFANAFVNKTQWIAKRGMSGGRYRDINEPYQSDYLDMAAAALTAFRNHEGRKG